MPTLIEQQAYRDAAEGRRSISGALKVIKYLWLRSELQKETK